MSGVLRPFCYDASLFYGALSIPTSKLVDGRRLTDILSRPFVFAGCVAQPMYSVFSALIVDRIGGSDAVC